MLLRSIEPFSTTKMLSVQYDDSTDMLPVPKALSFRFNPCSLPVLIDCTNKKELDD